MKKKLLVVVGAGASMDFGMPSVWDVGVLLADKSLSSFPLVHDPARSLYSWMVDEIKGHWASAMKPAFLRDPNFEDVLYTIFGLSALYPHGLLTSSIGAMASLRAFPEVTYILGSGRADERVFRELSVFLVDAILDRFREKCRVLEPVSTAEVDLMRNFFDALQSEFEVAVITLNYDDIVQRGAAGLPTGFDGGGVFNERLIFGRAAWPCLLHLHGSVHFDMRARGADLHEIHWQDDLSAPFHQNSSGRNSLDTPEGATFPQSVIVAGYGKTSQILRRPFRTYYSELDRLAYGADALLCLGYGFGDAHLNAALAAFRDPRQRPVVLVDFAGDDQISAAGTEWDARPRSIGEAMQLLRTRPDSMRALGRSLPQSVGDMKGALALDRSADPATPLAIWYNGMLEACRNPSKVMACL